MTAKLCCCVYLFVDDRELLKGGDDDACAGVDGIAKLFGVFVDFYDNAFDMVKLIDGVLKLTVKDFPVGDNDGRFEDFLVLHGRAVLKGGVRAMQSRLISRFRRCAG